MLWQIGYSIYAFGLTKPEISDLLVVFQMFWKSGWEERALWYDHPKDIAKAAIPEYTPMCATFSGKFHKKDLL
jgi:hypothetical protein